MKREEYSLLAQRIEEGYYLPKDKQETLPPVPKDYNSKEIEIFYEECKKTLEACNQRMQVFEQKEKAAIELVHAKDMTDMANGLIADFDKRLQAEYDDYKHIAEEKIKKIREDLTDAKEISSNALNRCDELEKQVSQLTEEKNMLKKTLEGKEEIIAYYESDFSNVLEVDGKPIGFIGRNEDEQFAQKLQEREDEIEKLKMSMEEIKKQAMITIATDMIDYGVAYLSNINKVVEEDVSLGEKILKHMISDGCVEHIGQQTVDKLRNRISYITDKREQAKDEFEKRLAGEQEKEKQKAEAQELARLKTEQDRTQAIKDGSDALIKVVSKPTVNNDIKQLNMGEGKYITQPLKKQLK